MLRRMRIKNFGSSWGLLYPPAIFTMLNAPTAAFLLLLLLVERKGGLLSSRCVFPHKAARCANAKHSSRCLITMV